MVKDTKSFLEEMEKRIKLKEDIYGDSWKKESIGFLERRINHKWEEYLLTKNPNKLISLSNLAMLLHLKIENRK